MYLCDDNYKFSTRSSSFGVCLLICIMNFIIRPKLYNFSILCILVNKISIILSLASIRNLTGVVE